jgi:type III secretory pathway component EscR
MEMWIFLLDFSSWRLKLSSYSVSLIMSVYKIQLSLICPFMVWEKIFSFSLLAVGLSPFLSYDSSSRVYAF